VHLLLWIGGACLGFVAPRASAQIVAERWPVVTVSGACPESSAVQKVLLTLLPAPVSGGLIVTVDVSDLGDAFVVAVGERVKKYADSTRDCAERARVAAAFIALVLAPEAQPSPSPTNTSPAAAVPPPVASVRDGATPAPPGSGPDGGTMATPAVSRGWLRVDARGALEVAPESGLFAPGAMLRIAAGRNAFGAHAVCGWLAQTSVGLRGETGRVLLERFPCAAGPTLRLLPGGGRLEVQLDAGIALGAVLASGRDFASSYDAARLEIGARVAVDAALHVDTRRTGFVPIVGVEATYYPTVYGLDVMFLGALSHTPYAWVGFTAGIGWNPE
jgi:hypothetical protein